MNTQKFVILNKRDGNQVLLQYLSLGKSEIARATIAALKAVNGGHSIKVNGLEIYHNGACDCGIGNALQTEELYSDLLNRL
jgi:predicted ABC-type ATPase